MIHGDFHIKNIMKQNGENLLIDMDTLAMGHPIYEISGIHTAYIAYSCVDKNNVVSFFGITREQADEIWNSTLEFYFEGKSAQYVEDIERKAAVISYARCLRNFIRSGDESDFMKRQKDFCIDYLAENVPLLDTLAF